jgi:DNA repair protein RecO (recombination protein O)
MLVKDTAIVLRRLDYSETSQVLALLTREHGQQRVIAKGIKRSTKTRVAVGIDLLERGRVVFSRRPGKEDVLATLTEWRQEENYPHLRTDLARCYAAQYAAEVTSQLTEVHDPHPGLFTVLGELLAALRDRPPASALASYLWQLLTEIGLRPELARCMSCGRPVEGDRTVYFSSREGGAICRDCEPAVVEKRRVAPDVLRAVTGAPVADGRTANESLALLDYHLTQIMGRPAKLAQPLREFVLGRP